MSINFRSNDFYDAVIFSGVDVNYENQLDKNLAGPAKERALEGLKNSYESHKAQLNFKYGRFLKIVEENLSQLNQPESTPPHVRHAVAAKLDELANRRITAKESHFSGLHTFFHKIGQFFKGHGFRTKGEWGRELADKIERTDLKSYKSELKRCLSHGLGLRLGERPPQEIIEEMKDTTNNLSEVSFRRIVNDVVFKIKESDFFVLEKKKYTFYKNLNEDKRRIFHEELMSDKNKNSWYEKALDIIEGSDNEKVKAFVSSEMVSRFQSNPQAVTRSYKSQTRVFENFFYVIVEKALRNYLNQNEGNFSAIAQLLHDNPDIDREKILNSPKLLTDAEIERLQINLIL